MNADETEFFSGCLCQVINYLLDGLRDGTHCNNDVFCIRGTVVCKWLVCAAGNCIDLLHILIDSIVKICIEAV